MTRSVSLALALAAREMPPPTRADPSDDPADSAVDDSVEHELVVAEPR